MPVSAAGAGGGIISSIIGSGEAASEANQALNARNQAAAQWIQLNVPDPAQQAIELQQYKVSGQLSPKYQSAFQQAQTGLNGMKVDPTGRAAEVSALSQMEDLSRNGGLDAQAEQQTQQAINQANANEQGQRGAIVQNAAARGVGGSGAQLAAELLASQGDANQAASGGLQAASGAQARALQAMQNASTAGNALNSSDYSQAATAAEAQDAINRFNTQNSQGVANANVSAANAAQAANLANAQSVANANTGVANEQEVANKGLLQQQFNNNATKATGAANALGGVATQHNTNATNTANQWNGIGQAVSAGSGALSKAYNNSPSTPNPDSQAGMTANGYGPNAYANAGSVNAPGTDNGVGPMPKGYAEGGEVKDHDLFEKILAAARALKVQHAA